MLNYIKVASKLCIFKCKDLLEINEYTENEGNLVKKFNLKQAVQEVADIVKFHLQIRSIKFSIKFDKNILKTAQVLGV